MSIVQRGVDINGVVAGVHATVTASDNVTTGLRKVRGVIACVNSDLADTDQWITASVADQYATPGVITIKTWMPTGAADITPTAGVGGFGLNVSWLAFGD